MPRLQAAARDARKEYSELSSKGLAELKAFVKVCNARGPRLLVLPPTVCKSMQDHLQRKPSSTFSPGSHGRCWGHPHCTA